MFSVKDFFNKCDQTADLVTFTEEILNGKFYFCVVDDFIHIFCYSELKHELGTKWSVNKVF